jgi:hypothetical protein
MPCTLKTVDSVPDYIGMHEAAAVSASWEEKYGRKNQNKVTDSFDTRPVVAMISFVYESMPGL